MALTVLQAATMKHDICVLLLRCGLCVFAFIRRPSTCSQALGPVALKIL
jgi:hypothetical protein